MINFLILSNSKIILNNESLFSKIFWQKMNKNKVVISDMFHSVLRFLRRLNFQKITLKNLRLIYQAGGKLDE